MNIGDAVTGRVSGSVSGGRRYTHALTIMAITDPTPDRNSTTAIDRKHVLKTRLRRCG
jgi:hypothetical protein